MSKIAELDRELNQMILEGQALKAFEKFYADDVVMQENSAAPTEGKAANRRREIEFFDSVGEFHGAEVLGSGTGDGVTFSEWVFDVTFKGGPRKRLEQASVRRWKDDRIVRERFYYDAD